jgi:hypothetical protein
LTTSTPCETSFFARPSIAMVGDGERLRARWFSMLLFFSKRAAYLFGALGRMADLKVRC